MEVKIVEVLYRDPSPGSRASEFITKLSNGKIHRSTYTDMALGIKEKRLLYRYQDQGDTAITITDEGLIITLIQN